VPVNPEHLERKFLTVNSGFTNRQIDPSTRSPRCRGPSAAGQIECSPDKVLERTRKGLGCESSEQSRVRGLTRLAFRKKKAYSMTRSTRALINTAVTSAFVKPTPIAAAMELIAVRGRQQQWKHEGEMTRWPPLHQAPQMR
jgi:hypothetical protein